MQSRTLFIFIIILLFFGCEKPINNQSDKVIAEVSGKILFKSELDKRFMLNNIDHSDSLDYATNYIKQWIKQQLLVAEAEHSLSSDELNIQLELEKYRQELIIYKYKNKRISEIGDSTFEHHEIENYYKNNLNSFILDHEIVKVNYIIFPIEVELPNDFKMQLTSKRESDLSAAEDFIFKYAKKYDDFNGNWIYFDNLTQQMADKILNPGKFLSTHKIIEFNTETETHLIIVNDFYLTGEQAPVEFVSPRIRSLLLNAKKLDFLREIKDSLYNNALKYNKFRVFN